MAAVAAAVSTGLSVLWLIVQGLLWVLLAIVLVIVLALVIPTSVWLRCEQDVLTVKVGMLVPWMQVYPPKEKPEQAQTQKKKKQPKQKKSKTGTKLKIPFGQLLDAICAAVRAAGMVMRLILGALKITEICIHVPVTGKDMADTAIAYGRMNAWLFGSLAFLNNFLYLEFEEVQLTPIFEENFTGSADFSCKVSAQLFIMVVVIIRLLQTLRREDALRALLMQIVRKPK